jgi:hypothetical protein
MGATIDKQQADIDRLGRMKFGRKSGRIDGPTLFDDLPDPHPDPAESGTPAARPAPLSCLPHFRKIICATVAPTTRRRLRAASSPRLDVAMRAGPNITRTRCQKPP